MPDRVLVVDDDPAIIFMMTEKLSREYFEVISAANGFDALQRVAEEKPDVVLLDVMIPGLDGFEVCQRIRSNPETADTPVIMVTALSDVADRVRGLVVGADDFLTKPANDMALFARIRSLIRLKLVMDQWRLREVRKFGSVRSLPMSWMSAVKGAAILVVEDSGTDAALILETLRVDQGQPTGVAGVAAALELARQVAYDLFVISLTLRDGDGLSLVSQLRAQESTRQTPVVLLGEAEELEVAAKGLELGANDYLLKPIERNELLARCRTQIRRQRFQEQMRLNYEHSIAIATTGTL